MAGETSGGATALPSEDSRLYEALSALFEADTLICALFDAQARRRILLAWETGWITAEDAVGLLFDLDLIETDGGADG